MPRAFVLLNRERRQDFETRQKVLAGEAVVLNGEESPKRIIPVQYSDDPRPLVTTTAKVIGFLIVFITAVVAINGFILKSSFEATVDGRFDRFELRLTKEYALAKETMPRSEYELRHSELIQRDAQMTDRINELEKRMRELEGRTLSTERNGRR